MRFELASAGRILFGPGVMRELPGIAIRMGKKPFIVCGKGGADPAGLLKQLDASGISGRTFTVVGEPTVDLVRLGCQTAQEQGCDYVIAYGGGSVIDTGKAISAMLTNPGDLLDYLEVIGQGKVIANPPLPVIALPTTAGTGAEVTRNAVIASPQHHYKASLRSPMLVPKVVLVDPDLTLSLPPGPTASTGMDALTQLIEPFVCNRANPVTDGYCREGMRLAAGALRQVYTHGEDRSARERMSAASLLGGMALANAGLGAVHGFASPIGGLYPAPHGAICARLLAPVMAANIRALQQRMPDSPVLGRYQEIARLLTGNPDAQTPDGVAWLQQLTADLNIPRLSKYGVREAEIPDLVERAAQASSMKANPITLTREELAAILSEAL